MPQGIEPDLTREIAGETGHGGDRLSEGASDPHRDVGSPENVVKNGDRYWDQKHGTLIYVHNDKAVALSPVDRKIVTVMRREDVGDLTDTGRFTPLPDPEPNPGGQ